MLRCCSNTPIVNPYEEGEFCLSAWSPGFLPKIILSAGNGNLSSESKYIVLNAQLGSIAKDTEQVYTVSKNGKLVIRAFDSVTIHSGFNIDNGGRVEIKCQGNVNLGKCQILKGGKLLVKAKNVIMGSGFKLEKGGQLKIERL